MNIDVSKNRLDAALDVELTRIGVPKILLGARWSDLPAAICPAGLHRDIVWCGKPGRGKSYAAAALLREWVKEYGTCRQSEGGDVVTYRSDALWANVTRFLNAMRASFRNTANSAEGPTLERVRATLLLVLDDLGAQRQTEWASDVLYDLISGRIEAERRTWVTTNLEPAELRGWHPRLASRLMRFAPIRVEGRDRRRDDQPTG